MPQETVILPMLNHFGGGAYTVVGLVWLLFLSIVTLMAYTTPSIIAYFRRHHRFWPIVAINLLLGWTFFGWIGAFVWSLMPVPADQRRHPWRRTREQAGAANPPSAAS